MDIEIRRKIKKAMFRISPVLSSRIIYRRAMKTSLHLHPPKTFNEKIQWLKLYELPKSRNAIECADKYLVRKYVEKKGYGNLLNDLFGTWDSVDDIPWIDLPDQFVLKCNHGCQYNILCPDKRKLNIDEAKSKLSKWMKEDFAFVFGELHYHTIPRKIICEKYLGNLIFDYKFFCFNGVVKFLYMSQGETIDTLRFIFYDMNGRVLPFSRSDGGILENAKLPENLNEMENICRDLSHDFKFARVDLFEVNKKIYFSEITLTPAAGMMPFSPESIDIELGNQLKME